MVTCVGWRRASAVRQASSTTFSTCAGPMIRSLYTVASMNSLSSATSCCVSVPTRSWYCNPVIAITGWRSILASYSPLSRWMPPGPEVDRQQPSRPVNLAQAVAMNAAASSCRTWTKRTSSRRLRNASMTPFTPSPGMPNTVSTPQAWSVSTRTSAAVADMAGLRGSPTEPWLQHFVPVRSPGVRSGVYTGIDRCHTAPSFLLWSIIGDAMATTRAFKSGNSQAVRIPAEPMAGSSPCSAGQRVAISIV